MRSTIISQNDIEIAKCVIANEKIYRVIENRIKDYDHWLSSAGLRVIRTTIEYKEGKICFKQPFLDVSRSDPDFIAQAIIALEFSEFGLDASPNNFLGDGVLVDLYPFLVDQREILELQFDYPYEEIKSRYFYKTSVLATYLIRLYKINSRKSLELVSEYKELLQAGIKSHEVLSRECCRLLKLMALGIGGESKFETYYIQTKKRHIFLDEDRDRLLLLLGSLTD